MRDAKTLIHAITVCCTAKADLVARDEVGAWTRATHVTLAQSREIGAGEWEFYLSRA